MKDSDKIARQTFNVARAHMAAGEYLHAIVILHNLTATTDRLSNELSANSLIELRIDTLTSLAYSYAITGKRKLADQYLRRFHDTFPDQVESLGRLKVSVDNAERIFKETQTKHRRKLYTFYKESIDQMDQKVQDGQLQDAEHFFTLATMHAGLENNHVASTNLRAAIKRGFNEWERLFASIELASFADNEEMEFHLLTKTII